MPLTLEDLKLEAQNHQREEAAKDRTPRAITVQVLCRWFKATESNIRYILRDRGIRPIYKVGSTGVFSKAQAQEVGREVLKIRQWNKDRRASAKTKKANDMLPKKFRE